MLERIKKMEVQILSKEMIKPSIPTPNHLKEFKLSLLDQIVTPFYIPLTLFYNTKFDLSNISEVHSQLKRSLSETLPLFYPFAGRLQNLFFVDCNDEGVSYTEATASFTLSEFLQNPDLNCLNKFLPRHANVLDDGFEIQVAIQATVLGCGGLAIGACMFHKIADFTTMVNFLRSWASRFRGTSDKEVNHPDLTLGSSVFPPLSSIPRDYETSSAKYYFYEGNYSVTRRFVFDASSIATLRAKATSKRVPNPTRIEVLTCFIIKRLMACLESRSENPPPTLMVSHVVDLRRRFDPPLPNSALGSFVWVVAALYDHSEQNLELPDYVEPLREVLHEIDGESVREWDPENTVRTITESQQMMNENDGLKPYKFTSWCNMGVYDLNFGWGRPAWVAHMGDGADRSTKHQFLFLEGKNGGDIELWVLFGEEEVALLENDPEFAAFATPNPSIPLM